MTHALVTCGTEPAAAPILEDKVLDVRVSEDQERVQFVIGPQQGQPGGPG
jgi:hypothetical protein